MSNYKVRQVEKDKTEMLTRMLLNIVSADHLEPKMMVRLSLWSCTGLHEGDFSYSLKFPTDSPLTS